MIRPTEDEIRRAAHELFEMRGRTHGEDVSDWLLAERMLAFHKNYERLSFHLLDGPRKEWIGPNPPQRCRFCRKSSPEVSFSNTAHAVPELLGNRTVFLRDECDDCNSHFGTRVEDHLGKFLSGARTLATIRGKSGVPSARMRAAGGKSTTLAFKDGGIVVNVADPAHVQFDPVTQSATFNLVSEPHIPLAVYKSFTKIALSVHPDSTLPGFDATRAWLLNPDHTVGAAVFSGAFVNTWFTPGPFPERYGFVELYRRRADGLRVPFAVCIVVVKHFTYQVYVPLCEFDRHMTGSTGELPFYPGGFHAIGREYGETTMKRMPLSSASATTLPFTTRFSMGGDQSPGQ